MFSPSVHCSGSLSTVNETNCNKKEIRAKKFCELTSNSILIRATARNLKLKANIAIMYVDQFERWTESSEKISCPRRMRLCQPGWMGSSMGSHDTWCKRFFHDDSGYVIRSKLHWSFFTVLYKVRHQCPLYFLISSGVRRYVWSSFASSSHSLHFCSDHPIASCDSRCTGSLRNRS